MIEKYVKHISHVVDDLNSFLESRRTGKMSPIVSRWRKLNYRLNGGFEPGTVITIAGTSGSGKSAFANMLETDLIDLNKNEKIVVLNFSFEMISEKQVGRKLSNRMKATTSTIYGNKDENISATISREADKLRDYDIYYIDESMSVKQMEEVIDEFRESFCTNGEWLIVIIDHTLLVDNEGGDDKKTLETLEKMLIRQKKIGRTTVFQITQLNRNIEQPERINNKILHYPQRSDLSSSDSIFQASDVVMVVHRPETLGIMYYGVNQLASKDLVFIHFLKNREGSLAILKFTNDLAHNNLIEGEAENNQSQQLEFK